MIFDDSASSNRKENKLSYDDAFKRFFSRKAALAVLLKEIIPNYHDLPISEIEELIISSRINQLNAETLAEEEDVIFGSKIMYYVVIYDISGVSDAGHITYVYDGIIYDIGGVSDAEYESLIPIKYLGDCVNDFYIMVLLTHYQKNRLKN